jgi:prepilin-type N-terminal cleavage/methylation domain-containing protein
MRVTGHFRSGARGAFTLIELLLVVALVLMLSSAVVFNFSNLLKSNHLEEGTTRLETLMRFARAQAANSGRKVQLVFSSESTNTPAASTGEVRATWEPDPLKQPGCFADLTEAQWHVQEINDLVQVESVKLLDASTACPTVESCDEEFDEEFTNSAPAKPMAPITFYPDGSSDSAEIVVATRSTDSPEEEQRMTVRLVGMTGSISHQLLTADLDEPLGEAGSLDRLGVPRRDSLVREPGTDRDSTPRLSSSRPAENSSRVAPSAPRVTVGETNSVDRSE